MPFPFNSIDALSADELSPKLISPPTVLGSVGLPAPVQAKNCAVPATEVSQKRITPPPLTCLL
ncbi:MULTISPECIES: hypothetical protein [unclassified Pseudoalteromonas]|uniref:hypothetical protein n=1 Tax=unclassified Pseudoalteromonas TaxID=194690 RepID=UPI0005A65ABD|nr:MULTISPECIES: hypothetical protein [unclassified Pseudoalteromonas]